MTYIMSTPNSDAPWHQWVSALAKYDFWLEHQKGQDNAAADVLSWVTTCLKPEAGQSILDGAAMGASREQKERTKPSLKMTNN